MQRYHEVFGEISGIEIRNQNDREIIEEAEEIKFLDAGGLPKERRE